MATTVWSEGVRKYLGEYSTEHHVKSSRERVIGVLKLFRIWLVGIFKVPDPPLSSVRRQTVEAYRTFRLKQQRSRWTINGEIAKLRAFFRWCTEQELSSSDPTRGLRRLRCGRRMLNRYVPLSTIQILVDAFERQHRYKWADYFKLIGNSGLRGGEAAMLREVDVDLERRGVWLRCRDDWQPKDQEERFVPLNEPGMAAVCRRLQSVGRSGLLFATKTGKPMGRWTAIHELQKLAQKLDLPHVTVHGMRRTFTIETINEGWNSFQVQCYLGHEDIKTTEGYVDEARRLRLPVPKVKIV